VAIYNRFQLLVIKQNENNLKKKKKKNITSDTINKIIPNFKPFCTIFVCFPSKLDSRIISVNQDSTINIKIIKLYIDKYIPIFLK